MTFRLPYKHSCPLCAKDEPPVDNRDSVSSSAHEPEDSTLIKQYQLALLEKNEFINQLLKERNSREQPKHVSGVPASKIIVLAGDDAVLEKMLEYKKMYEVINNSFFWKLTKPLRIILDYLKKLFR